MQEYIYEPQKQEDSADWKVDASKIQIDLLITVILLITGDDLSIFQVFS